MGIRRKGALKQALSPDLEGSGPSGPVLGGGAMIATQMKEVVDQIVG